MRFAKGVLLAICLIFLPLKAALALNCYFGTANGAVEKSEAIMPSPFRPIPNPAIKSGNLTI